MRQIHTDESKGPIYRQINSILKTDTAAVSVSQNKAKSL